MERQIEEKHHQHQNERNYPLQVRDAILRIKSIYQYRILRNQTFFGQSVSAYQILL
ncbi:MAG: hypothetical protein Q6364_03945 [Candidatus Hermodarchaeota archaeon]|nr:hypothetical protein [Candidatus Hermodarchaeota archaeon]